jgi:hypothetical protein
MRQEESQYLANDIEEIKKLPEWTQQWVGYGLSRPFLGRGNLSNLMLVLHPGVRTDTSTGIEHGLPLAPITVELSIGIKDRHSAPGDFM